MSGSPKFTFARLRAAQERALREARAAAAAQERARRAVEEQRRRAERVERARAEVRQELEVFRRREISLATTDIKDQVTPELESLEHELSRIEVQLGQASELAGVQRAARDARLVRARIVQTLARGRASAQAAGRVEVEAILLEMRERAAALDRRAVERFDPNASQDLNRLVSEAEQALGQHAQAKARHLLDQARARLEQHLADTQSRFDHWAEVRNRALARLAEFSDRVGGLRADQVVARWAVDELKAMERQVEAARARIEAGECAAAEAEIASAQAAIEPLLQKAQDAQLREDRRNYLVAGIIEVMGRMGFVVQAGSPAPEDPGQPDSPTIIQARRIGGGAIAVSVPQDGDLWYDVDGFPKRLEPAPDGGLAPTCDEAEAQIERMHAALDESFGIETGELLWQGKATRPDRKQADRLPESHGAPRRAEGRS